MATIYLNGVVVAQETLGSFNPLTTYDLYLGRRVSGAPDELFAFSGLIDEPSIYNRALSSNEIAAIYNAGSAGKCELVAPAIPQIFNIAPAIATNGAPITIAGTNFNSFAVSNIVYFGAVQATVLSANLTNLVVTVPVGATFAPVTVTVGGLTAFANQMFLPTFIGAGAGISASSFGPRLDLPAGNNAYRAILADIDGDGKPDLVVGNVYGNSFSVYRNISTNGLLTVASFAPRVDFATSTGELSPMGLAVADVDGDGKLDVVATDNSSSLVSIYRNTSTPSGISSNSFAPRVDWTTGSHPQGVTIRDIDGDGRPDLLIANGDDGTVSIYRNIGVAGELTTNSFAPKIDIATGSGCDDVVAGDLDDDGKPDVATANTGNNTLSILHNISSPGNIVFDSKTDLVTPDGPIKLVIGDLDGDGKLDLAVACYLSQTHAFFPNISSVGSLTTNSFSPRIDYSLGGRGHTPALADLDGDGKPDLAVVTELNSLLSVFQNISTPGGFTNSSLAMRVDFPAGYNAWGVTVGDLDGDGRPDVVFCNQYDSTVSIYQNIVPLNVPPVITAQPGSQTVPAGSNVVLSVTANGVTPLSYQWSFNGTNLLGATANTLALSNLHISQTGNYHVSIVNAYGTTTSTDAIVTVMPQDILIYSYSGKEHIITFSQELSYNYSGQMLLTPASTNGVFVGWDNINGKKIYWVSALTDYLWINIPHKTGLGYTVIGRAGYGIDTNSYPHFWSYLHRGANASLIIAKKRTFTFPNTFNDVDTHVYPDAQTGSLIQLDASSSYQFITANTQTANNTGQTLPDLINALSKTLEKQGYQKQ